MSCLQSSNGAWNGWFNGEFGRCIAETQNNLWIAAAITLKNTLIGFATGVSSGGMLGLLLGRSDRLSVIFYPYIVAANSIPRIALAPIVTQTVIVPSTMAWVFASLSPAVSFALIGVIVDEFSGTEHGIGRMIIESEARGEAAGMMVAIFVLTTVGVILASFVRRLRNYLLRWRAETRPPG